MVCLFSIICLLSWVMFVIFHKLDYWFSCLLFSVSYVALLDSSHQDIWVHSLWKGCHYALLKSWQIIFWSFDIYSQACLDFIYSISTAIFSLTTSVVSSLVFWYHFMNPLFYKRSNSLVLLLLLHVLQTLIPQNHHHTLSSTRCDWGTQCSDLHPLKRPTICSYNRQMQPDCDCY